MEVTLKIEAHQIGETIEEVFKHLTPEQKAGLAEDTVRSWLSAPYAGEREAYEEQALQDVRKKNVRIGYYGSNRTSGQPGVKDSEIRETEEYRTRMREWRSTRERLITGICEETLKHAKEFAETSIKNDPKTQEVLESVRKSIEATFPQMVYGAMVRWMAGNMGDVLNLARADVQVDLLNTQDELARLKSDLQSKYNLQIG